MICQILTDNFYSGLKIYITVCLVHFFDFREADIGKSKAEVAAEYINNRIDGVNVVAHNCKIQDKDLNFYRRFSIVICGLDSIVARRWLNDTMVYNLN